MYDVPDHTARWPGPLMLRLRRRSCDYDFRVQHVSQANVRSSYKFTGKERDTETGLDYFGARYYGSNMGRWMSPDWAARPKTVPYADFGDPQSLNLYGYVRNNPWGIFSIPISNFR